MEWIPNQPVIFGEETQCDSCDDFTFNQLVDNTDKTQFQFEIDSCVASPQLLPNPNFDGETGWDVAEPLNWIISEGQLCHVSGASDAVSSVLQFTENKYYKLIIVVDSISMGGSFEILLGENSIGTITSSGTYEFFGYAISAGALNLFISPSNASDEICFSGIQAYQINQEIIIAIYNKDEDYVTEINYSEDPEAFIFSENTVTVTIDWAALGLSNNCYYLCLLDPCINSGGQNLPAQIINCEFVNGASPYGWEVGDAWTPGVGSIAAHWGVSLDNTISQEDVFGNYTTVYCITIIISAISNATIDVKFGTNSVAQITTAGTHTVCGVAEDDFSLNIEISPIVILSPATVTITDVCPVEVEPEDYVCNSRSNEFKLADYSNACTMLINACNNENGMGFAFNGSGFSPRLRLEAKLKNPGYKNERTIFEDSAGTKKNVYYSRRKQKVLAIDLQPEYIHDFLSLSLGFDNFYINGLPYSVDDDEYNIEYNDANDNIGKVKILVSEKTQNVKNINCSDGENVCNLGPDYLLQSDDLTQNIILVNGENILING